KVAKVDLNAYATKSNRKKLTGAYSDKSPLKAVFLSKDEDTKVAIYATDGRAVIFSASQLATKSTRNTQGVVVMALKRKQVVESAVLRAECPIQNEGRYAAKTIPSPGAILKDEDVEQISLGI
ncbi:MAG: topoisomerase IV, partial [Eubacteriales bacterium]